MATLQIDLPDDMREVLERQAISGGFQDAGEYVKALLQDICLAPCHDQIEEVLLKRVEAADRGEATEMTAQDWQRLRNGLREHVSKRNGT